MANQPFPIRTNPVLSPAKRGEVAAELFVLLTQQIPAAVKNALQPQLDIMPVLLIHLVQFEKLDHGIAQLYSLGLL